MQINVTGYSTVGEAQEFLPEKVIHEVFVFDSHVFPNIVTQRTKVDLSVRRILREFPVDAVNNAKLVPKDFPSVLITFRNKADYLIKSLELNNSEVPRLECADARMAKCGTSKFGQPYREKYLPTQIHELINAFCSRGLDSLIFEAVRTYNLGIEKRHANT